MKDSVKSYNIFLDIPDFMKNLLYPFMPLFTEEEPSPDEVPEILREFEKNYTVIM